MVTTPAAPWKPVDLPEQGPAAFAEAFPEQDEDTTVNHALAWLDTADGQDTVPDVPDSPTFTAFLHQLPDLSEYVAEGGCPKERLVPAGLGDSEDTVPDVPHFPNSLASTALLNELHDFSEYVADGGRGMLRIPISAKYVGSVYRGVVLFESSFCFCVTFQRLLAKFNR